MSDTGEHLEIRQIVAVEAVAKTRSLKSAAELMNTTQPTLSRLIRAAESTLQTTLFRRGWSGADTTPKGDMTVRTCGAILAAIDDAGRQVFGPQTSAPTLSRNLRNAHLQAIAAITNEGSVSRAARALGRSQPDLSRTISDFSKRFGITLFRRSAAGMEPLAPARTLTDLHGTLIHHLDALSAQLSQLEGQIVGRVAVGMLPFSEQELISAAFARMANQHPNIRLSCVPGSYNALVKALRCREIDRIVGITRGKACPQGLWEERLFDEKFVVIANRDHPIQKNGREIAHLSRTNWVVAPHGTPVRAHFERVFSDLNAQAPTQTCEMLSFNAAECMLVESSSVAMLTYSENRLRNLRPELAEVHTLFHPARTSVGLTCLQGEADDPALDLFDNTLRELVGERILRHKGSMSASNPI
ncbi:hypothetical protein MACH17_24100 [Phaeobacter inhibens]|uniref:LysR family transcriptional regulator n=1 Tax=Phaeobacter inhibens TaxID=221822 RepID=UPI00274FA274|nr:LysR family transcriptional regulator [Phaeobacter inhibens]GLO70893.1 hypothetical protein MACH17_24100 [Phaeobacter inhibens]